MIKVTNSMEIYETDGKDVKEFPAPQCIIESHWNSPDRVVLLLPDGKRYTVIVRDIEAAIRNAANMNRF